MHLETWPQLPKIITNVPGPKSINISRQERRLRTSGISAAAQWSELVIVEGKGCMVHDADGNVLMDACSGTVVMNIGHGNEKIAEAIYSQSRKLTHFYDFASQVRLDFLKALLVITPQSCESFILLNSGTEAIEAALRVSRSYTKRFEIISFRNGYHGRTFGALSLTSGPSRRGMGPMMPGTFMVSAPMCLSTDTPEQLSVKVGRCIEEFQKLIESACTDTPAAVVIEPIQGAGGTNLMPREFLQFLRAFCSKNKILLIFDEVLTGAGRTGKMWAHEHFGVEPDLLVAGKGMAGGLPFGMLGGPSRVLNAGSMGLPTRNSSTFGGNPIVCAAGIVTIKELLEGELITNASLVGGAFIGDLQNRLLGYESIKDVRGMGLMIGIELAKLPATSSVTMDELISSFLLSMLKKGAVTSSTSSVLRITPPLSLSKTQACWLAVTIESSVKEVFENHYIL